MYIFHSKYKELEAQEYRELAAAVKAHGGEYVFSIAIKMTLMINGAKPMAMMTFQSSMVVISGWIKTIASM